MSKVRIRWSSPFAYAIGLIATDGNLSKDGRHINLTSKDRELIVTFKDCLGIENKIGRKTRAKSKVKKYFQVQFGDRNFYEFLLNLGLTPAKSKTIASLKIPNKYFIDFLRGCIDGDGSIRISYHPESQHPQLQIRLVSASEKFLSWLRKKISLLLRTKGGWIEEKRSVFVLVYAKADSIKLINRLYYTGVRYCLKRKFAIAKRFLRM